MLPDIPVPLYPFVPLMPGVPALTRAPIDASAPQLLIQAVVTGSPSALLSSMLDGAIPSMLNGLTQPLGELASLLNPVAVAQDALQSVLGPASGVLDSLPGSSSSAPQWGIFDDGGNAVVTPDSVYAVNWKGAYRVINYPVEEGNFETYNKVQEPFQVQVVMRQGGGVSDRQDFINALMGIRGDLNLYTVTTPEISFVDVNITDVSLPREGGMGATMMEVRVDLQQINTNASSSFSNVKNPTSEDPTNSGTADATTPTTQQQAAVPPGGPS